MTYTFWHAGVLIGESDLSENSRHPRHHAGTFRPTAYGLEIFPRLTGFLSASHALKAHLEEQGRSTEDVQQSELEYLFETTPAGQKIIDIGRALSEVEVHAPDGKRLEIASIAFSDLHELQTLVRELRIEDGEDLSEIPPDGPRYVVSLTFGKARQRRWRSPQL